MPTARDYAFKYDKRGVTTPQDKLHPGEPWFFLRAHDKLSTHAICAYAEALKDESNAYRVSGKDALADDLMKQAIGVLSVVSRFIDWQDDNDDKVKLPD